ncbi:MAG: DUF1232 domain-containing protein [Endomicrobiales bacterium]
MNKSQIFNLLQESNLTVDELAERMGIAGMTLRRWKKELPDDSLLPAIYEKTFIDVVYKLVSEERIARSSSTVEALTREGHYMPLDIVKTYLGITAETLKSAEQKNTKPLLESLVNIGESQTKQKEVDASGKMLATLSKMGKEWKRRITILCDVIKSKELLSSEKLIAYGALFYLICPFDLIPDNIPIIGYLDDFIVLGFAVAYYNKKMSKKYKEADKSFKITAVKQSC